MSSRLQNNENPISTIEIPATLSAVHDDEDDEDGCPSLIPEFAVPVPISEDDTSILNTAVDTENNIAAQEDAPKIPVRMLAYFCDKMR